jgi:hypothetical protein
MTWLLIVISCALHSDDCVQQKRVFQTEAACGIESRITAARIAREKPAARVIYFCQEATNAT